MELTPSMQSFVLHWGEMGPRWGMNRSVAQIFALLHISPSPLTAEDISSTLSLARSNVSTGLKELHGWQVIRTTRQLGDRRDWFTTIRDVDELAITIAEHRRQRELHPTLAALSDLVEESQTDNTPAQVAERMAETQRILEEMDTLTSQALSLSPLARKAVLNGDILVDLLSQSMDETGQKPKKKKKKSS